MNNQNASPSRASCTSSPLQIMKRTKPFLVCLCLMPRTYAHLACEIQDVKSRIVCGSAHTYLQQRAFLAKPQLSGARDLVRIRAQGGPDCLWRDADGAFPGGPEVESRSLPPRKRGATPPSSPSISLPVELGPSAGTRSPRLDGGRRYHRVPLLHQYGQKRRGDK